MVQHKENINGNSPHAAESQRQIPTHSPETIHTVVQITAGEIQFSITVTPCN